ncbi:MAG: ferredoxin reductase family protein [Kiritimatiellae bacterium]|jgi:predicted ferric reductase|nr:ferredoxin reductase family protein [Kiritimatiellia bacterium]
MNIAINKTTWYDSKMWGSLLLLVYTLLAMLPLALAYSLNPVSGQPLLQAIGKGAGLLGFSLLMLQFTLGARFHWIDQPYGLDQVMIFHKGMGIFAGALILLHPVLLALSHGSWSLFVNTSWPINFGKAALLLLVLTIVLALFFKKIHMDYNTWRFIHKGVILVIILGFVHSFIVGDDIQNTGMRAYWIALFTIGILIFLFRNVYVPLFGRQRVQVSSVSRESHDTWTLAFESKNGNALPQHRPGQFWFLKLIRPGRSSEQHPFTISSSPIGEPPMTCTIKESGNFTETIGKTQIGDQARIEGPFGRFSLVNYPAKSFLFIAGGVGITPIISMLRYLHDTGDTRPAVLIYGNKKEEDILFRDELSDMPEHLKVVHVLSEPDSNWQGPKGHIATDLIRQETENLLEKADVFLCGPPVMMDKMIETLKELGVAGRHIHYERFSI